MEEAFAAAMARRGGRPAYLRRLSLEAGSEVPVRGGRCAEDHAEFVLFRRNACQLLESMLERLEDHRGRLVWLEEEVVALKAGGGGGKDIFDMEEEAAKLGL